ncbi:elongator complex protein 4 isoform X1 [Physcomitrium patens]|uniref:Elongator complex protein 4 n=2 Tax=Physcomitrium patens TaxID=3218 RepID=A0A2K1K4C8_PHYPA|nr:elongator complex protein 4-like [Physcomitrium patens]XP_024385694.1 elongator complex protein 4-like [Physcomitrium patens]XP_024385695.1 elongator complex protein 4-like [Physcomitrium patens]PNR48620.1 hypothetical protein PHYPA_013097 [Physcomitrium patens]|eukprot:XP_024385693.1 elongator complex protein 4-like [Physcomitrella patens]
MEMKAGRSFVRKGAAGSGSSGAGGYIQAKGVKPGSHGVSLVSSGLDDLDQIIGGGIPVGSLVMIMEDNEAPHHMLLLRYFMAQGLVHSQPLFFASPLPSPQAFLGTLPAIASARESKSRPMGPKDSSGQDELRIAWQYRRYLSEQKALEERRLRQQELTASSWASSSSSFSHSSAVGSYEFCNDFDMRKPLERSLLIGSKCESLASGAHLGDLLDQCKEFAAKLARPAGEVQTVGRLALQSLCAPQCVQSCTDWELLAFLHSLKGIVRTSNSVAVITFPASLLRPTMAIRWQHFADILLSVESALDEDKEMAGMLTDYQEIVGFLRVHKLASINTQIPSVPDANVHTMKVVRRKKLILERLLFAPVDAVSGDSGSGSAASLLCGQPANAPSKYDF